MPHEPSAIAIRVMIAHTLPYGGFMSLSDARALSVLTIAGSDSGGGAGIQADLRTFAAHGLHGASAITAVTAQNSVAVVDFVALDPRMVVAQIEAVASDMPVAAVKTGMLATPAIVAAVAEAASRL